MTTNRDRALAAAIDLLATEGIRALTHRRVDDKAGLPKGSTSNAFRTRDALIQGVTQHMVALELPPIRSSLDATSAEALAVSLTNLFTHLTGPLRSQTSARLALYAEAINDEAIRDVLNSARPRVVDPIRRAFEDLGARDPDFAVQLIATCFEGLFLHVLGGRGSPDPKRMIQATVSAALAA